ncbi:hypothetical protein [Luteolibacter luteus]|uniref:Uncharacterized protein n=1 Tax=Luteolibacter luteus TaxID=2728835 RepID=A0A858RK19_9BACT|nr:hypothetical protein [Luteolibacter luteus]QJE97212.1 hypothetical protein HHL09_15925 [Luteolibacter luteus]
MQRIHPFPTPGPLPTPGLPASTLTVVEEDYGIPAATRVSAPAPKESKMIAMPTPAPRLTAKSLNGDDDPFDDSFMADSRPQLDHGPRFNHLPRFVPLQQDVYGTTRDPWAIHSIVDMFRLYLPEVSISTGAVAFSGLMAGQITHHFIHSIEASWVLAAYIVLFLMNLASLYFGARGKPALQVKGGFRNLLITTILLCIPHFVASAILKASA